MVVAVAVCQPLTSGACVCVCVARPHFGKSLDFSLIKLELPDFFLYFCIFNPSDFASSSGISNTLSPLRRAISYTHAFGILK